MAVASDRGATGEYVNEAVIAWAIDVSGPQALMDVSRSINQQPYKYMRSPPAMSLGIAVDQAHDLLVNHGEVVMHRACDIDQTARALSISTNAAACKCDQRHFDREPITVSGRR